MLHAREGAGHIGAGPVADEALDRGEGGKIVEHVVLAREPDLILVQHLAHLAAVHTAEHAVPQHAPLLDRAAVREPCLLRLREALEIGAVFVVEIEHQMRVRALVLEDRALGVDVVLIVPVLIQMVGRDVGHDGDIRRADHAVQLEGAQLQHGDVVGADVRGLAQQRMPDVPAEMHAVSRRLQQLGKDGRGRGLSVAAGDGDHLAGAEREEDLHLRRDPAAALPGRLQMRLKGHEPGGAEDQLLIEPLEIVTTQPELCAHGLEPVGLLPHLLARALIAGGDPAPAAQQQFDQGLITHADTDDGDAFVPDALHIFRKGQTQHLTKLN